MRQELLETRNRDPFKLLGVSAEDKMTFYLLKWVFNAIKQESDVEDKYLMGKPFVTKTELVKQLVKNNEIMSALDYKDTKKLEKDIKKAACMKDGVLSWDEFLNFFFLKESNLLDQLSVNEWWTKIDLEGHKIDSKRTPTKDEGQFDDYESNH
jgi:hypothetical protein